MAWTSILGDPDNGTNDTNRRQNTESCSDSLLRHQYDTNDEAACRCSLLYNYSSNTGIAGISVDDEKRWL